MSKKDEALKLALEALEDIADEVFSPYDNKLGNAILALRAALAEPHAIQVRPSDFAELVKGKETVTGIPAYWSEWPNKEAV